MLQNILDLDMVLLNSKIWKSSILHNIIVFATL